MVEGPVEKVSRKEVREAIRKMKQGKAAGLSEVATEMIAAGGRIEEEVMLQLCREFWMERESRMNGKSALWCQLLREKKM